MEPVSDDDDDDDDEGDGSHVMTMMVLTDDDTYPIQIRGVWPLTTAPQWPTGTGFASSSWQ